MNTNFNNNVENVLKLITVNGKLYQIGADASNTEGGIAKLFNDYTTYAASTDGAYDAATVHTKIEALNSASTLSVTKDGSAATNPTISADGSTYVLKQGTTSIATFNIAKDVFVREGSVVYGTYNSATDTFTAGTADGSYSNAFIKLVLDEDNDGTTVTKTIYIPAASLVKAYTANNASGAKIEVSIDSNNNVTAAVSSAFQAEIDNKKVKQTAYTASGMATDKTVATLTQNANGEIAATFQTIQDASASQHGLMSAAQYSKVAAIDASVTGTTLDIVTEATV